MIEGFQKSGTGITELPNLVSVLSSGHCLSCFLKSFWDQRRAKVTSLSDSFVMIFQGFIYFTWLIGIFALAFLHNLLLPEIIGQYYFKRCLFILPHASSGTSIEYTWYIFTGYCLFPMSFSWCFISFCLHVLIWVLSTHLPDRNTLRWAQLIWAHDLGYIGLPFEEGVATWDANCYIHEMKKQRELKLEVNLFGAVVWWPTPSIQVPQLKFPKLILNSSIRWGTRIQILKPLG